MEVRCAGGEGGAGTMAEPPAVPSSASQVHPNGAPMAEAVEVETPEGLPEGWKCIERKYLSGQHIGKIYQRFNSADGKHKNILSIREAISIVAKEKGENAEEAIEKYELLKIKKKDDRERARLD